MLSGQNRALYLVHLIGRNDCPRAPTSARGDDVVSVFLSRPVELVRVNDHRYRLIHPSGADIYVQIAPQQRKRRSEVRGDY